jgi:hypothetical protein
MLPDVIVLSEPSVDDDLRPLCPPPRSRGVFLYDGPVYRHTVLAWLKWIGTQALSLPQEPMHVATVLLRFPTRSYVGGVLGLAVYR